MAYYFIVNIFIYYFIPVTYFTLLFITLLQYLAFSLYTAARNGLGLGTDIKKEETDMKNKNTKTTPKKPKI